MELEISSLIATHSNQGLERELVFSSRGSSHTLEKKLLNDCRPTHPYYYPTCACASRGYVIGVYAPYAKKYACNMLVI